MQTEGVIYSVPMATPIPPAVWEKVGEVVMSGAASINLLELSDKLYRVYVLSVEIMRDSASEYINKRHLPYRGYYGNFAISKDGFVTYFADINYPLQRWTLPYDLCNELQRMIPCIDQEIMQSIANLGTALGAIPISIENETSEWLVLDFGPDTIQFSFEPGVGAFVSLWGVPLDVCNELPSAPPPPAHPPKPSDPPPPPPPAPGQPVPQRLPFRNNILTPPGVAIPISPSNSSDSSYTYHPDSIDYNAPTIAGTWMIYASWTNHPDYAGVDSYAGYENDDPQWITTPGSGAATLIATGSDRRVMSATPGLTNDPTSQIYILSKSFSVA